MIIINLYMNNKLLDSSGIKDRYIKPDVSFQNKETLPRLAGMTRPPRIFGQPGFIRALMSTNMGKLLRG